MKKMQVSLGTKADDKFSVRQINKGNKGKDIAEKAQKKSDWFSSLTKKQQKEYVELHPNSKFSNRS